MALGYVGEWTAIQGTGARTITGAAVGAGQSLLVFVTTPEQEPTGLTVTDSLSNTWTQIEGYAVSPSGSGQVLRAYFLAAAEGVTSVTATPASAPRTALMAVILGGDTPATPTAAGVTRTGVLAFDGPTVNADEGGAVVVVFAFGSTSRTFTLDAGAYTALSQSMSASSLAMYGARYVPAAAGDTHAAWTVASGSAASPGILAVHIPVVEPEPEPVPLDTPVVTVVAETDPSAWDAEDGSVTISWPAVTDADRYEVGIAAGHDQETGFVTVEPAATSPYVIEDLAGGDYTVAVRAHPAEEG